MDVEHVFVVYQRFDGAAVATGSVAKATIYDDGEEVDLEPRRKSEADDLYRNCEEICNDVRNMQIAAKTNSELLRLMQQAQQTGGIGE